MRHNTILMLLSNAYDPDPRVRQEALALIRLGCRVRILAWDRDLKCKGAEKIEGVEVERVFLRSAHGRGATQIFFYAWLYIKMLWRGLRTEFDAVHCHDLDTLPLGFVMGKLQHKPIVYDAHESFPDMLQGSVPKSLQKVLVTLENLLIRNVDLLITVGEKLRHHFVDRGARHAVVVGNWKRLDDFTRTLQEIRSIRERLAIPENSLVVACITQLLKDRQIKELLTAIEACPDVYLILGGKGILEEMVRQAATSNPRIRYVGFVSGEEIADYTCASDIIYYGFDPANPNARFSAPNKLYEALAAGKPLLTGNFGEIADVVRKAGCGIVMREYSVPEIQRALKTLTDTATRHLMAANAAHFGRNFCNWEKGEEILRQQYSVLLPELLRGPATSSATSF